MRSPLDVLFRLFGLEPSRRFVTEEEFERLPPLRISILGKDKMTYSPSVHAQYADAFRYADQERPAQRQRRRESELRLARAAARSHPEQALLPPTRVACL